ncbi:MAG: hypothetical protein ABL984_12525 [Pyrinomonadaceae bacterium]
MKTIAIFLALFIIAACSRPLLIDPPGPPDPPDPIVNGRMLSAEMSDAQILEVFGIDISKAEARELKGKDGYQTHYTLGDQRVNIVRSAVSGVFIYADGPIKGHWDLETKDVPKY